MEHVKFVSYTGKYPNLCSGVLTLNIDGEEHTFGYYENCEFKKFWSSGGSCSFDSDWNDYVTSGEWEIYKDELPMQFQKYYLEIKEVFNANVPQGCCGGCL